MKVLFKFLFFLFLHSPFSYSQDYCLRFFGNGVNDIDRVKIPIDDQQKLINIGESFTIEFQLKYSLSENPLGAQAMQGQNDDWTLGHIIIDRDIFGVGDYGDFGISIAAGRLCFGVNNSSQSFTLITDQVLPENAWNLIAVTRNHISGEMKIFINGVLSASYTDGPQGNISYRIGRPTNFANDPFLVIAAEKHDYDKNTYPSFSGFLDNIRISNIVRYNNNYQPSEYIADSFTVAFYDFNEGSGNIVYDKSFLGLIRSNGLLMYGGNPPGPVYFLKSQTNLNEFASQDQERYLDIYPQPARSLIYLKTNFELSKFEFYNLLGEKINFEIKQSSNNLKVINLNELSNGIYIIKYFDNEKFQTKKFILNK